MCRYLRPYLLDGRKFDLRLYALVTSWCPLVVYLHSGGIARFATRPYSLDPSTLGDGSIHLTNFTLNPTAQRLMLPELKARLTAEIGVEVHTPHAHLARAHTRRTTLPHTNPLHSGRSLSLSPSLTLPAFAVNGAALGRAVAPHR